MKIQKFNNMSTNKNINTKTTPSFTSKAIMTRTLKAFLDPKATEVFERGIEKDLKRNGSNNSVIYGLKAKIGGAFMTAVVTQKRLFPSRIYEGFAEMPLTGKQISEKDAQELYWNAVTHSKLVETPPKQK